MSLKMFDGFLKSLSKITIDDCLLFGVFGEPFSDPYLEERIRLVNERFPELDIEIASNAALATPSRVAQIAPLVRRIWLHVEAVTADAYSRLMPPLRSADVFRQIEQLTMLAPDELGITTPLHRGNLHEIQSLHEYSTRIGLEIRFSELQTRATTRTMARQTVLAPTGGFWHPDLIRILVLDWDGAVLATCDDFLRRQVLGSIAEDALPDILDGAPRRALFEALRTYDWQALLSIFDAIVDDRKIIESFSKIYAPRIDHWTYHAHRLQHTRAAERALGGLHFGHLPHDSNEAPVMYGPYLSLDDGRYLARIIGKLSAQSENSQLSIRFEISAGFGNYCYATIERCGGELASVDHPFEFRHSASAGPVECRAFVVRSDPTCSFSFKRVIFSRLSVTSE